MLQSGTVASGSAPVAPGAPQAVSLVSTRAVSTASTLIRFQLKDAPFVNCRYLDGCLRVGQSHDRPTDSSPAHSPRPSDCSRQRLPRQAAWMAVPAYCSRLGHSCCPDKYSVPSSCLRYSQCWTAAPCRDYFPRSRRRDEFAHFRSKAVRYWRYCLAGFPDNFPDRCWQADSSRLYFRLGYSPYSWHTLRSGSCCTAPASACNRDSDYYCC